MIWFLLYAVGYLAGVVYAINVARRAYADTDSMLWDAPLFGGEPRIYAGAAVGAGMAVIFTPLIWPLIGLGMLGWALVMRGVGDRQETR